MKANIFVTRPIPERVERYLEQHCQIKKWDSKSEMPRQQLLEQLAEVEGLLTTGGSIDAELLEHAPRLKIVSNISVGYNNFDIKAMAERKVMGTNTPYVLDETVADLIFGLILAAGRRLAELDRYVKEGKWKKGDDEPLFGTDIHSSTLGIIGMGRIGEAVARRAALGFKMNVLYYNRSRRMEAEQKYGAKYTGFEELLEESDYILLMTPLTPATTKLIGKKEFERMKETAFFINASRGQTVDEQALIEALQSGEIKGAGLDVYEEEPVQADNPLLTMDQVVTVPHIGSATAQTREEMAMHAARNLVQALAGQKPESLVDELKDLF